MWDKTLMVVLLLLTSLTARAYELSDLSSEDRERMISVQTTVNLKLSPADMDAILKNILTLKRPALSEAALKVMGALADYPSLVQIIKDEVLRNADCAVSLSGIEAIGAMGAKSQSETRQLAKSALDELNQAVSAKSLACAQAQPTQIQNLQAAVVTAARKLQ